MTFESKLIEIVGTQADAYDIRATVRKCYHYDFADAPVRLWDGEGKLYAGGFEWLGTVVADGGNVHQSAALQDPRDGASPAYEFTLPFVDKTNFDAMKADRSLAEGRALTIYYVLCEEGEGLRPTTEMRFCAKLIMTGTKFVEQVTGSPGSFQFVRSATVVARTSTGRSRIPGFTWTDTSQRTRAALLGITSDSGFSTNNDGRTYFVGGGV